MKLQLQNIANLFKNVRTRSIIIVTGCILVFGFLYGYLHLTNKKPVSESSIQLEGSPNIQSVPGGLTQSPSADYQRLQAQQNLEQAVIAEKTGASSIPTLLNTNQFNQGQMGQGINGSSPCPMNNGCSPCDACAKYMACAGVQSATILGSSLQPSQLKSGTLIYDTQGKVIGHLGVDGKVRDSNGQIIGQVGPDGLVRTEDGTVIGSAAVPAMGDAVYDVAGRLIGTVGRDGKVRDAKGRVIGTVGPDGIVRNLKGAVIGKVVVPKASIVIPAYDKKGHLIGTMDADGKLRDANGHIIGEVDADGTVRNAEGDIIGKTGVNMTGAPVYDPEGHLLGTIGADGKLRDAAGNIIGEVDANGVVRNSAGKIIGHAYLKGTHEKRQAIPGTPVYDHQGKLIGTLDSDGEVRNAQGKVIGKIDSDGLIRGLHDEIIGELGATAPGTPVYDKLGHLVGTVGSDGIVRGGQGKALGKLGVDGIVRDVQGNPIGSITPPHRHTSSSSNENNGSTTNAAVSLIPDATNKPTPELQAILDRQAQQISAQKAEQLQQQMQGSMSTQASQLFAAWTSPNQQYVAGTPDLNRLGVGLGGALSASPAGAKAPAVKAGTIMYAVLLTAVNSDEPGPVLAEIVQGKFKGARLMGTLSNQGQKVLLSFNTLTLPKLSESVAINTVAIDENTARTALSSDTNNHYWLRYGTLFASAFIQGYGQSFINSAPNYYISLLPPGPGPNPQPVQNLLSPRDRIFVGLGQVGLQYSSVLRDIFNTPPTVKVFSGTPMGILFLSDLAALPTS